MRLNPDCIREILLTVEENTSFDDAMDYSPKNHDNFPLLKPFTSDEVLYHISQCDMAGLIIVGLCYDDTGRVIGDLTPEGHDFLATVRGNNIWGKAKQRAEEIGAKSLTVLIEIATDIAIKLAKERL